MSVLRDVINAIEAFDRSVDTQAQRARKDSGVAKELLRRWRETNTAIPSTTTPTGLCLPRLALPELDEPGAIARFLHGEGLPGEFPYLSCAYPELYLDRHESEEPTRLFAGLGLAEDTNERFHLLTRHQRSHRMSTAFDGPTLYGMDSDEPGVFGKIGEGGVAIDTVEDMEKLYAGFDLIAPATS